MPQWSPLAVGQHFSVAAHVCGGKNQKNNILLCNFLATEPARKKPLAKTLMFERARDGKCKHLFDV